jgi:hypothetical protein
VEIPLPFWEISPDGTLERDLGANAAAKIRQKGMKTHQRREMKTRKPCRNSGQHRPMTDEWDDEIDQLRPRPLKGEELIPKNEKEVWEDGLDLAHGKIF